MVRVSLSLAEHFLNWYPYETKLYIRGERGKSHYIVDALHKELFDQLCKFFEKHGISTMRNDLLLAKAQLQAWRDVHKAWNRWARVCSSARNFEIVNEAIGKAVALDSKG